jgi:hypothetical protein
MDPFLLRTLHVAGAVVLFTTFGALFAGNASPKKAAMWHGISLVFILMIGFAMLKRPPMDQYWWMAKLGLWLFLGVAPVLAKRAVMPRSVVLGLCLIAAVAATWLGLAKPF